MWERMYEEFWDKLEHFCYKLCRDEDRAEDLTQEVFLKALQNRTLIEQFTPGQCKAWLFAAARNLYCDQVRRAVKEESLLALLDPADADPPDEPAEAALGTVDLDSLLGTLVPLDLRFTPSQNAQNFFKNYKKKQTAARMLVDLLAEGEKEIAYLETVLYEVETASGEAALNEIRAELKSQGYLKYYKQRDKRQKPADFLRFTSTDGFEILVGRNNAQNDKLTLHTARGKDLWFHVQKAPGSHVVVMSRGEDIPDSTKQEAAELAVLYSSAFKAGPGAKVAVDTTEVKNIWKANGAKPGMVLYEVYTTVYITPREGLEEQLKKK